MKSKGFAFIIFLGIFLMSCVNQKEDSNTVSIWVNSQTVDCSGVGQMKCMQIQESDSIIDGQWQNFYSKIEGFNFEKGYIYHLKVKKEELDPKTLPADASNIKYTLIEQISKEKVPVSMNGVWTLVSINMKTLAAQDEKMIPEIKIDTQAKKIKGFNGCNRITMSYDLSADSGIKFEPGIMTRMACPGPNYEHDFMEALNQAASYSLSDARLVFYNSDGVEVLNFSRK